MSFTENQKLKLKDGLDKLFTKVTTAKNDKPVKIPAVIAGVTNKEGNIYTGAKGVKSIETNEPIDINTMVAYFSCTKSMTAMAILHLYDHGLIDLDKPAKAYLPLIDNIGLIDPNLVNKETGEFTIDPRKPKNEILIKHLLLHIAGFAYPFTNKDIGILAMKKNPHINITDATIEYFSNDKVPLTHEPGSKFSYGQSFDWLGLIVQEITGKSIGQYLSENIFKPATMDNCTFKTDHPETFLQIHKRNKDESVRILQKMAVAYNPKIEMGGQGCFGTVGDYLKFLRIWLNKGYSPDGKVQILKSETVEWAIKDHLPSGVRVSMGDDAPMPPGFEPDGFTLTGLARSVNEYPTGRPSQSLYWGGLANLTFWLDFENNIAGFWGTQLFPQLDMICLMNSLQFEFQVYEALEASKEQLKKSSNL